MKPIQKILGMLMVVMVMAGCAELDQFAKNVQSSMPQTNSLGKIIAGLKEALKPPPECPPSPAKRRSRKMTHVRGGNVVDGPWAS